MRSLIVLAALAACKDGDGALLTVSATQGPLTATRIEIVLASTMIDTIDHQRVQPGQLTEQSVRYYKQRDTAGIVRDVGKLDGFQVRIEPTAARTPDTQFIPFVLAYQGDTLAAIGMIDNAGDPGTVVVEQGRLVEYSVILTPVTAANPDAAVGANQARAVACDTWTSGIVWRRGSGTELRLLLPDVSADPLAYDATMRALDLDCDNHVASPQDCDDSRATFFRGKPNDVCDGLDTNCDGARTIVVDCPVGTTVCPSGVGDALCADTGNGMVVPGTCSPDPACACASGNTLPCTRCVMDWKHTSDVAKQDVCAPAASMLVVDCTPAQPCDRIAVIPSDPAWRAEIATDPTSFTDELMDVHGPIFVRVDHSGGAVPGGAGASVGAIYLAIDRGGVPTKLGIDLELGANATDSCMAIGMSNDVAMQCQ